MIITFFASVFLSFDYILARDYDFFMFFSLIFPKKSLELCHSFNTESWYYYIIKKKVGGFSDTPSHLAVLDASPL